MKVAVGSYNTCITYNPFLTKVISPAVLEVGEGALIYKIMGSLM